MKKLETLTAQQQQLNKTTEENILFISHTHFVVLVLLC